MPGNELQVVNYIISRRGKLNLPHIGPVISVANPESNGRLVEINNVNQVSSDNATKKADIFLNQKGVSIKQEGGSFAYNRILRSGCLNIFQNLRFQNPSECLKKIDALVDKFHNSSSMTRNQHWSEAFNQTEFKSFVEYLMMKGSPKALSPFPASYILLAKQSPRVDSDLRLLTFEEFFEIYQNKLSLAIRRSWVGQDSVSEHTRAKSIAQNPLNGPWVFDEVAGSPNSGWMTDWPVKERKTTYFIMIELKD